MQAEKILQAIAQRDFSPIYFLTGEEPYFIDVIVKELENNVLTEDEKNFNQIILYGKDANIEEIIAYAKQFPMMSEHTVVIVKEAQHLSRTIDKLEAYAKDPLRSTILVFAYKYNKLDKRKILSKLLEKQFVLFESKKLYDNQLPNWIEKFLTQKNKKIADKAKFLLIDSIGNDLSRMANELNKLCDLVEDTIELNDIEKNIGINKDFNNFELQNALMAKNIYKTNQIIHYFGHNPKEHPLVVTLSILYTLFSNLIIYHSLTDKSKQNVASALGIHPFFIADYQTAAKNYPLKKTVQIISHLRQADLLSKGFGGSMLNSTDILKELTFKILH